MLENLNNEQKRIIESIKENFNDSESLLQLKSIIDELFEEIEQNELNEHISSNYSSDEDNELEVDLRYDSDGDIVKINKEIFRKRKIDEPNDYLDNEPDFIKRNKLNRCKLSQDLKSFIYWDNKNNNWNEIYPSFDIDNNEIVSLEEIKNIKEFCNWF